MNRSLILRVGSVFVFATLSLILAACAAVTPPSEASAQLGKEVQTAWWKTRTANSGRFEYTVRVNLESEEGHFGPYETTLYGSFSHTNDAAELFVDLAPSLAILTQVEESLPAELTPEIVHVRMVGTETWARARLGDEWERITEDGAQEEIRAALVGQFEGMLETLASATVESTGYSDILGEQRFYSGYLGAPTSFTGVDAYLADAILGRMFTFTMWLDEQGYAVELIIESDFNRVLEAMGESTDEVVEMSYHLVWYDLDTTVDIEPPPV